MELLQLLLLNKNCKMHIIKVQKLGENELNKKIIESKMYKKGVFCYDIA